MSGVDDELHVVRKAVIPVAGLGTRLLPLTKALPKEILPILDRPVIQVIIDELVASGIHDVIIVTAARKGVIQEHFAPDPVLEQHLRALGKNESADEVLRASSTAHITYIYQEGPYGNGTPVLNAARVVGDQPFLVLWGDDFFISTTPRAAQLLEAYASVRAPVVALTSIDQRDASRYGVPRVVRAVGGRILEIDRIVEKPAPHEAPSEYACVGGYIVTPEVVTELSFLNPDDTGEVYLSRALDAYARRGPLYGVVIDGEWHDTGTIASYLRAVFDAALRDPKLAPDLLELAKQHLA